MVKKLAQEEGKNYTATAHYAAKKGVENVANFLGGFGARRLYMCLEPNGDMKPRVFFASGKRTILGSILKDDFERVWDSHLFLWALRSREKLENYNVGKRVVGMWKML